WVLAQSEQSAGDGDVPEVVAGGARERPVLAPAGHPAVDEPRVAGQAGVGTEPQAFGRSGAKSLDQHVRLLHEIEDGGYAIGVLEVDRHTGPAAVEQVVVTAGERLPAGPVDPDHVVSEVGQDHAG